LLPVSAQASAPPDVTAPEPTVQDRFDPVTIEPPAERPAERPAVTGEPAPSATPPITEPAPSEGPAAPPAAEPTATVANAEIGSETAVDQSRYKIGKGFSVASKDGRFSLNVRGRIQLRYDFENPNTAGDDPTHSLQIRRARIALQGNVFSPYVKYYFQFGFSPRDMSNDLPSDPTSIRRNPLRDARIEIDRLRDFTLWMGQMKVPFSRQRVVSSSSLNMVDRSSVSAQFNLDRDIGLQVLSKDLGGLGGKLGYNVGVFMGEGRNAFNTTDFGLLYVARVEVKPFGKFEDYSEGDVTRSETPGLSIGAAYAFQDRAHPARGVTGDAPADGGTTDFHHATADIMFKYRGVSLHTAAHLRRGFNRVNGGALDEMGNPIPTAPALQGVAWFAQLGYLVPKIPLELVGRYGMIRKVEFGGDPTGQVDADEVGLGANWYFVGHDLKLQLDYFRGWDESMGATYAEQAKHGTDRVRVQFQIFF
jgi:hypothetical protein